MAIALIIIGLLMIITGGRGTYAQFGSQLASEFQGNNSFTYQMIAIGAIGAFGYIPAMQTISRWTLALILLVILLGNKNSSGFFTQFQAALSAGPTAPQPIAQGAPTGTSVITPAQVQSAQAGQTVQGTATVPGVSNTLSGLFQSLITNNPIWNVNPSSGF